MLRDATCAVTYGIPFSDTGTQSTLAQNIAQTFTVPSNPNPIYPKKAAIFSIDPGLRVFVANNATATVPGDSFAATTSELNPTLRYVAPGDVISCITPDSSAYVNVKFYAVQ
jgi:hypothetical protein